MLTVQEREALKKAIDLAVEAAQRVIDILDIMQSERKIVNQIEPPIQMDDFMGYVDRFKKFAREILRIKELENEIPDTFKTFLQNQFVTYDWSGNQLTAQYNHHKIINFFGRQENDRLVVQQSDANCVQFLRQVPTLVNGLIMDWERKVAQYQIFDKIKWIDTNIVMIGANGSGKSTFARQLRGKISSNVSILSAQHVLVYTKNESLPASQGEIQKVHSFQKSDKLSSNSEFYRLIERDMTQLVTALLADDTDKALKHYRGAEREESYLEKVVEIWKELLNHRELVIERGYLSVKPKEGEPYEFNNLSDGEKAVFYYIGHVLLMEKNSYIIIDEPENHMNLAICNKLWDRLEHERSDCKFIYLTHNVDFAVSRTNTTVVWNRRFVPPNIWDFEIIESDKTMPDTLLMEVLGSRKNICFCEGKDKSSWDYKVYSVLFPEYTVIPVGGHLDVISYTNAYNEAATYGNVAIGIVDGDCHREAQITKWALQNVYAIPISEIENVMCDSIVLKSAVDVFASDAQALDNYYSLFWCELEREKVRQAVWYTNNQINNKFKENFLQEKSDIENLKAELSGITSAEEIDKEYQERILHIESVLSQRDYDTAIRMVNFKGRLTGHIAKKIVDKYPDRVIGLLKRDAKLRAAVKQKYFDMIP